MYIFHFIAHVISCDNMFVGFNKTEKNLNHSLLFSFHINFPMIITI